MLLYASQCEYDLEYPCELPQVYFPNTSCPWTISTRFMVEFIDHIHFGFCLILYYLLPRTCSVLSPKLSLPLMDLLILLISSYVLFNVGTSDDPICVHFAFKRKILHNALSMGELSYIIQNTHIYASLFDPYRVLCAWNLNLFVLVFCAIMRSLGSLVSCWNISPFGSWFYLIPCFLI